MTFPRTRICALSCICAQPASMRTYLYYRCVRIHISPPVFRHLLYLLILSLMSIADGCHPPFSFSLCSLQVDVIRRLPFLYVHSAGWFPPPSFSLCSLQVDVIRAFLFSMFITGGCHPPPSFSLCSLQVDVVHRPSVSPLPNLHISKKSCTFAP